MSSQIDPLTGLPMVFDSIIEQIPLDAQIFPYADLGATARPTAPPLYPDSIIPVSAFLSGQHPDTGSAQTVATDGQHNLRVHLQSSDVPSGAAPLPYADFSSGPSYGNVGVAGDVYVSDAFFLSTVIYGFALGFIPTAAAVATVSPMRVYIEDTNTLDDINLWEGFAHYFDGAAWKPNPINILYFYPQPLDITPITNGNADHWDFAIHVAPYDFSVIFKIFGH